MVEILERIKSASGSSTDMELANKLEISQQSIAKARATSKVPTSWIPRASQLFGVSMDWLYFGIGSMKLGESATQLISQPDEFTAVPKVEAKLAAGGGSFMTSDRIVEYFDFRTDWLRTKGSIKDMVLMDVSGDSMEPEIHDRDMVLIDQSKKNLMPGKIFAIGIEDAIYVKYFDTKPGKIILRSENERYSDITINTSEDLDSQFRVIGRVLWVCREY